MQDKFFAVVAVSHQERYIKIYNSKTMRLVNQDVQMLFTFYKDMKAFLPTNEWSIFTSMRMTERTALEFYKEVYDAYLGIKRRAFERYKDQFVDIINI